MKILLTNDDSIHSRGITLLAEELSRNHDIFVIAPNTEQSGISQAITFLRPLFPIRLGKEFEARGIRGYTVDGTPTDCVKLGLFELCPWKPDLVVSGINAGLNAGLNVMYSGTVAGAFAGATLGIRSIAISTEHDDPIDFAAATRVATPLIGQFREMELDWNAVININIPRNALQGEFETRLVPVESRPTPYHFLHGIDPKGRPYFWSVCDPDPEQDDIETDCSELAKGFVTVSLLAADLNHPNGIEPLRKQMPAPQAKP